MTGPHWFLEFSLVAAYLSPNLEDGHVFCPLPFVKCHPILSRTIAPGRLKSHTNVFGAYARPFLYASIHTVVNLTATSNSTTLLVTMGNYLLATSSKRRMQCVSTLGRPYLLCIVSVNPPLGDKPTKRHWEGEWARPAEILRQVGHCSSTSVVAIPCPSCLSR
ncbi:hypothetical protein CGRA01v4_05104 [Colletotrichum graminicola]|nr:hypothetical protein CGRA01v4_05104 [Colletotrichum graminicola]